MKSAKFKSVSPQTVIAEQLRGHPCNLAKQRNRSDLQKHFLLTNYKVTLLTNGKTKSYKINFYVI